MHSVLTVDLSAQPADVSVATIEGDVVTVRQRSTVDLAAFVSAANLKSLPNSETPPSNDDEVPSTQPLEIMGIEQSLETATQMLQECLKGFENSWTSSVVVVPPIDFLSLNLSLPFGDAKNLNKIIDLEIQDVVPFEIDEFLVQHRTLSGMPKSHGSTGDSGRGHDVHVGLIPRTVIKNVIDLSHRCDLEPVVVASPSSAIAGVFQIAPNYFKDNSAVVSFQSGHTCIAVRISGEVRAERVIVRSQGQQENEDDVKGLFSDIRLTLSSIERRYGARLDHVYVIGAVEKVNQLQQALARPVEQFTLEDVIRCEQKGSGYGILAAIFAREEDISSVLTNFRVREFAYSPRFTEMLSALRSAGSWFLVAGVMAFIALGSYFGAVQYKMRQEEIALVQQITNVIPDFVPPLDGNIISAIRTRETQLSEQLGALGSPSRNTPLDAFAAISRDLPSDIQNLQINSLKIRTGNLSLDGFAPDLSAVDRIEKALQANKTAYKKVTATTGSADPKRGYRFTVDILLNQ